MASHHSQRVDSVTELEQKAGCTAKQVREATTLCNLETMLLQVLDQCYSAEASHLVDHDPIVDMIRTALKDYGLDVKDDE